MSLIKRVQKDAQAIINSDRFGFSYALTLTDQASIEHKLKGIMSIIHNLVDPDTGQPVSGFLATVSINAADLFAKNIKIPVGEMSSAARPWLVSYIDQFLRVIEMKLVRSAPDLTNGNIICDLEHYQRMTPAVIGSPGVSVTEGVINSASVKLQIVDKNPGEAYFQPSIMNGTYGAAIITKNGQFTYNLHAKLVQGLALGAIITDNFIVKSIDGTIKNIVVIIHGSNDKPIIHAITAQSAVEKGAIITGQIIATDPDFSDLLTYSTAKKYPGFILKNDGSYTFDPSDLAYRHIAKNATEILTIPIIATDTNNLTDISDLVITVHGINEAPTNSDYVTLPKIIKNTPRTFTEAQFLSNASDIDSGDILQVAYISVSHAQATDPDKNRLIHVTPNSGYFGKVQFSYSIIDQQGGLINTRANSFIDDIASPAVITAPIINITAYSYMVIYAYLIITDANAGEAFFIPGHINGNYGSADLDKKGSFVYRVDNAAIKHIKKGVTVIDHIIVTSIDGTAKSVPINITGINDRPIMDPIAPVFLIKGGPIYHGKATATDADDDAILTFSTTSSAPQFNINTDGNYTFDQSKHNYDWMTPGLSSETHIPIVATDEHGLAANAVIVTITVTYPLPTPAPKTMIGAAKKHDQQGKK
jgi:VCBS repeat-containing protein